MIRKFPNTEDYVEAISEVLNWVTDLDIDPDMWYIHLTNIEVSALDLKDAKEVIINPRQQWTS